MDWIGFGYGVEISESTSAVLIIMTAGRNCGVRGEKQKRRSLVIRSKPTAHVSSICEFDGDILK